MLPSGSLQVSLDSSQSSAGAGLKPSSEVGILVAGRSRVATAALGGYQGGRGKALGFICAKLLFSLG